MTSYAVTGNAREQLGQEGAVELSAAQAEAIAVVAENIDAVVLVANSLAVPGFSDLASVVTACTNAQQLAQASAAQAGQSATNAAASAASVGSSAALAEAWARQMGTPVAGTDVSAKQSALNADASADQASGSADSAGDSAAAATAAEALAEAYASAPPGTEVEPGKFSIPTYVDQMQTLLGQAPVLAGRVISGGAAGETVVNLATTDFFHTIEVNNPVGSDTKLKCLQGLFTGPPPQGLARSYAWVHVIRSGDGAVTVEGPAAAGGGSVTTVFRPKRIARSVVDKSTATPGTATAVTGAVPTLAVPAGTSRRVVVVAYGTYWDQAPAANPVHNCSLTCANITGLAQLQVAGEGTNTGSAPIRVQLFSGTIDDSKGALADLGLNYNFGGYLARGHLEVYVFQDCSAIEHDTVSAVSGSPDKITKTLACSDANSVNLMAFAFRKATSAPVAVAASPVTADAEDQLWQATTGQTTNNDLAMATQQDAGLVATTYTYVATPAAASAPGVSTGLVLRPRTVTTGDAGDDGLITDSAKPFTIPSKGGHAMILAASDGTTWFADQ
ncbi:MAG TPA: hypothetical protein VGR74_14695 [Actinomycetota bacterium]|nr:hypothetical protein [Actinomycetota bacterium]